MRCGREASGTGLGMDHFFYLGSILHSSGRSYPDLLYRIEIASASMNSMSYVWASTKLSLATNMFTKAVLYQFSFSSSSSDIIHCALNFWHRCRPVPDASLPHRMSDDVGNRSVRDLQCALKLQTWCENLDQRNDRVLPYAIISSSCASSNVQSSTFDDDNENENESVDNVVNNDEAYIVARTINAY